MRPQRFARDERGTIAVITAGVVAALVGCLVLTADFGSLYLQRRQMQRAVDLAAMAAAGTHGDQQALALAVLSANGMGAAPDFTLYSGAYDADPALSPAARFTAGALPANAARIALRAPGRVYFIQALMPSAAPRIRVAATAAVRDVAMLQIGSRLASLQNGVLDALLGNLVGGSVSLTALDYQALADAQVDLLGLAQALAARSDSSGTYADVLGADISVGDLLGALADSLSMQAGGSPAATAVGKLRNALVGQGASLNGGSLVDLGPLAGLGLGETPEGISASVSALDLLRAAAMLKGGEISADLGAAAPGLLDAKLAITIGEGARQSAWLAVGESGVSVRTAQIRLLLLLALKPVLGFAVQVPLAVEVAYGEASLAEISCGRDPASDVQVDVAARPGLAGLWARRAAGRQLLEGFVEGTGHRTGRTGPRAADCFHNGIWRRRGGLGREPRPDLLRQPDSGKDAADGRQPRTGRNRAGFALRQRGTEAGHAGRRSRRGHQSGPGATASGALRAGAFGG